MRTLDLFCGGGGSSWGAKAAGAEIVCGVDAWEFASDVFMWNFPNALVLNQNLGGRSAKNKIRDLGNIDLILASPECTNHTWAKGNKPRDAESQRTARYVLSYANTLKPRWIVVENVVHMRIWDGYQRFVSDLERNYFVRTQILDAADFGVPQTRRRLFLICDRKRMPAEIERKKNAKRRAVAGILDREGTWPSQPLFSKTYPRAQPTLDRAKRAISELGKGIPFLIVYYGSDGSGGWQPLNRPLRTLTTLDRFGLVEWEGRTAMLRMLQVPELRRAMGFSSDFQLDIGTRREQIKILGNGVCPPMMEAIVKSLEY